MYWDTNNGKTHFLNKNSLTMLNNTFTHPYLSYCNHVWGNTCVGKLQNKLVKIMYNSEYDTNTEIMYKKNLSQ